MCQISRLRFDSCHYNCLYIVGVFAKENNTENFQKYYTDLIWEKTLPHFWDQDQFEVFKELIKNWISAFCWSFGNWLHISTSLIWPQSKHSIPVSSYISDLLYRVVVVSWFLCKSFNCIQTSTEFLNYWGVIHGTVSLYWWFACCGE